MRAAGYETAVIGKWHLQAEPASFDHYCVLPGQGSYFNPIFHEKGKPWPNNTRRVTGYDSVHSCDAITDLSIEWLTKKRDRSRPFFLMHHFKSPHDNFENAERYDFLYEDVTIPKPESLRARPKYGTSVGKRNSRRNMGQHMFVDPTLDDPAYQRTAYQRYLKKYLRCVKGVDDNVGRLLVALRASGELDDTVVIYTSDQGFMLGEHDYIDKRWMYEESMRMPFLIRYPRLVPAGSASQAIVNNTDFAPTILALAGAKAPAAMQGRDMSDVLRGRDKAGRSATYYRYWMHMTHHDNPAHYGIRTPTHKLIFFYGQPLDARGALKQPTEPYWELYDLRLDPQELHNVYGNPEYSDVTRDLKATLLALKKDAGDTDEKYPELMRVRERYWN